MLRVPLDHARAGMKLAMPVLHPDRSDTTLLRSGVQLTTPIIRRLRELHCRELWVEYPGLESVMECVDPHVQMDHGRLTRHIADAFDSVLTGWSPELDFVCYKRTIGSLIQSLLDNPRANIYVHELVGANRPMLRHSSNVAMLSVLMGMKLEFYLVCQRGRLRPHHASDVTPLGLGAMLHDIGMLRLDEDVLARWQRTLDETDPEFRQHVTLGYELLRGSIEPAAAACILHHHQRFDGKGFPQRRDGSKMVGLSGSRIHVFARVVAAADVFDRLRHPPGKPHLVRPMVRVLSEMRQAHYARRLDPIVLRSVFNVAPPYAPGSVVRLSTGQEAVVTAWTVEDPCRPVVEVIDVLDPREAREVIDLRVRRDIQVAQAEGHDVLEDNFTPKPGEFDLQELAKAMYQRSYEELQVRPGRAAAA